MENQKIITDVDFDKFVGLTASLYYNSKHEINTFQLGNVIFEVIEDEEDGYRSSMREVKILDMNAERKPGDFLATVRIEAVSMDYKTSWMLIDTEDNHLWLEFGTENSDDYYPYFIFNFQPKAQPILTN